MLFTLFNVIVSSIKVSFTVILAITLVVSCSECPCVQGPSFHTSGSWVSSHWARTLQRHLVSADKHWCQAVCASDSSVCQRNDAMTCPDTQRYFVVTLFENSVVALFFHGNRHTALHSQTVKIALTAVFVAFNYSFVFFRYGSAVYAQFNPVCHKQVFSQYDRIYHKVNAAW